ncbi:hypothetical protein FOA52_004455 [Chlamydomonas sp. UWO 241]|nr:hypothetical protein FOA52_004455 [Chlamydomonas sp. UWO 241]
MGAGTGVVRGRPRLGISLTKIDVSQSRDDGPLSETQQRRAKLALFENQCSQILPEGVYLSGDSVARSRGALGGERITHVLNCIGFLCPEVYKDELTYKTFYLHDNPGEDILSILFEALEFIDGAVRGGGRVLVHCSQGVSRSATLVIAYIMWRTGRSFDQVMAQVKAARGVVSPNIGFTCQLLQWQKARSADAPTRTRLYRLAPHCSLAPLMLVPKAVPTAPGFPGATFRQLDPRGAFVVAGPQRVYVWVGRSCSPDCAAAARRAALLLLKFGRPAGALRRLTADGGYGSIPDVSARGSPDQQSRGTSTGGILPPPSVVGPSPFTSGGCAPPLIRRGSFGGSPGGGGGGGVVEVTQGSEPPELIALLDPAPLLPVGPASGGGMRKAISVSAADAMMRVDDEEELASANAVALPAEDADDAAMAVDAMAVDDDVFAPPPPVPAARRNERRLSGVGSPQASGPTMSRLGPGGGAAGASSSRRSSLGLASSGRAPSCSSGGGSPPQCAAGVPGGGVASSSPPLLWGNNYPGGGSPATGIPPCGTAAATGGVGSPPQWGASGGGGPSPPSHAAAAGGDFSGGFADSGGATTSGTVGGTAGGTSSAGWRVRKVEEYGDEYDLYFAALQAQHQQQQLLAQQLGGRGGSNGAAFGEVVPGMRPTRSAQASPVPPDGPPPVRAPDDNPAFPMLVDDDVELVPPPAEEPKKRNAFDLMKASNLKAASQAKQLKKAKHAAAAPAAPAQAPEHLPHEDVPPATPTATPAADGPTIDATPIATSVKKKPPSSEAQKSWIKTFPFVFIATAVNLATNGAVLVGCSVCREIYGANSNKSYAAGNASVYSLSDLTKHSKCDEHKDAVDAKVKKDGGSGGIVAAAHAGARAHVEVLKGLLPTLLMGALWICTELLPGLKFASLLVALTKAGNTKLDDFGNDSFQQLKDHFWSGDGLPDSPFSARGESFMATLDTEFKHVKTVIKDRLALTPSAIMLNLWRFIARSSDSLMVPNIILLMNVYYVMALHTAKVERGFSIHRILKNRLRSRLMILMVDSLLRIWHLAQSFTGPRESENNSLINEAAEKLSVAGINIMRTASSFGPESPAHTGACNANASGAVPMGQHISDGPAHAPMAGSPMSAFLLEHLSASKDGLPQSPASAEGRMKKYRRGENFSSTTTAPTSNRVLSCETTPLTTTGVIATGLQPSPRSSLVQPASLNVWQHSNPASPIAQDPAAGTSPSTTPEWGRKPRDSSARKAKALYVAPRPDNLPSTTGPTTATTTTPSGPAYSTRSKSALTNRFTAALHEAAKKILGPRPREIPVSFNPSDASLKRAQALQAARARDAPQAEIKPSSAEGRMKKYRRGSEASGGSSLRMAIQQRARLVPTLASQFADAAEGLSPADSRGGSPFASRHGSPFGQPGR